MESNLLASLEEQGYKARIVPLARLADLRDSLESFHREGLIDEGLYQAYLAWFIFQPPEDLPGAQSIIIVAYPDPQTRITFHWRDQPVEAIVPPTYLHALANNERAGRLLAGLLGPLGYRVASTRLPLKRLAVCSGLAFYGKNNVTYVEGLGSYYRLAAFYSDLPCPEDPWQEPQMLPFCSRCSACQKACPTEAIFAGRFLLHAERCLTYLNEKPGRIPFPDWLDPAWHNSLEGCMHCQRICPENRSRLQTVEGPRFSSDETELLLSGVSLDQLPPASAEKVRQADLVDFLDVIPRNLGALLHSGKY